MEAGGLWPRVTFFRPLGYWAGFEHKKREQRHQKAKKPSISASLAQTYKNTSKVLKTQILKKISKYHTVQKNKKNEIKALLYPEKTLRWILNFEKCESLKISIAEPFFGLFVKRAILSRIFLSFSAFHGILRTRKYQENSVYLSYRNFLKQRIGELNAK
jgi:hypothetical protein